MRLRYTKQDGTQMEFQLAEQPITIGRSADADIVLLDERVSRIHCGVRLWDGDFYIKDLNRTPCVLPADDADVLHRMRIICPSPVIIIIASFSRTACAATTGRCGRRSSW
jgi:pSer/pThr/pTyr-binding forkhead associated (FHA) protein